MKYFITDTYIIKIINTNDKDHPYKINLQYTDKPNNKEIYFCSLSGVLGYIKFLEEGTFANYDDQKEFGCCPYWIDKTKIEEEDK